MGEKWNKGVGLEDQLRVSVLAPMRDDGSLAKAWHIADGEK